MTQELTIREDLKQNADNAVEQATALVVTDNKTNESATNFLKGVKTLIKEIETELEPAISQAHELHLTLTTQKKKFIDPLKGVEHTVKGKISKFLLDQEKIRIEEQRKAREKADAEERKRKAILEAQALAHEQNGRSEKAEERRQQAEEVFVPAPIIESKVEQQKGVATKVNWKFEITDISKIPTQYLKADEVAIGGVVRALKGNTNIPGVRVYSENTLAVRV